MKATWGRKLFSFLNKFVGVILFLICAWAIYQKVLHHPNLQAHGAEIQNQFKRISIIQWGLLIFLFLMNYTTEAMKWKILLAHWNPLSILKSLKIVLVGQAFAFFTPVRSGDYVGRILFLDAGNKWKGVAQMAWSNYAQLIITILMGTIGLFFNVPFYPWLKWFGPILLAIACYIYFHPGQFKGLLQKMTSIQIENNLKIKLLLFSLLKYFIFMVQYIWAVKIFLIPVSIWDLWVALSVMFLCLSIIPAISLTDLVIRGQLIVLLLAPYYDNSLMLISLSTLIWAVNFLLPAIIGAFLLLNFRLKQ
jgi:hypothetical protein